MFKNWKTTISGLIAAFVGYVCFDPELFGGKESFIVRLCTYITLGGLASLGIFAKDVNIR